MSQSRSSHRQSIKGGGTDEYKEFEMYIAFLYESLGFRVERNVNIGGQEVDVLADRFIPGIGQARVLVECKWRQKGSISNQEVQNFHSTVSSLRSKHLITRGVMVSNVRFSQDAFLAGQNCADIELLTAEALENQLFDLRHVFRTYMETYEASKIFLSYIHLRATWTRARRRSSVLSADIESTIVDWIDSKGEVKLISVLGDYGAGKTTLLQRLKYVYVQRYLTGESSLIPIFVPLKNFHAHGTLDQLLKSVIIAEFERDIPLSVFWKTLRSGRFLLLLDGFDEMAAEVDADKRRDNFLLLVPLLNKKSSVLLTCRPAYFVSAHEYNDLISSVNVQDAPLSICREDREAHSPSANTISSESLKRHLLTRMVNYEPVGKLEEARVCTVELESLNLEQIEQFLRSHDADYRSRCDCNWHQVRDFLFRIYDLKDLMSRPILLTIINETVLEGSIGIHSVIETLGPSRLYEIYTSMKLDMDWLKGGTRQLLSKFDRIVFTETLALAMFTRDALEIDYQTLLDLAQAGFYLPVGEKYLREISPIVLASDIQVCTFLTRSEDGLFRFGHKSFMEFFVALHLKKRVLADERTESLFERFLSKEVLYFLGGFSISEPKVRKMLIRWYFDKEKHPSGSHFVHNIASAILYSGPVQANLRLGNTDISNMDVSKARFISPVWENVKFTNSQLQSIKSEQADLRNMTLERSVITEWVLDGGFVDLSINYSELKELKSSGALISIRSRASRILVSSFAHGRLTISGEITLQDNKFEDIDFTLTAAVGAGLSLSDCQFTDSRVLSTQSDSIARMHGCSFVNCDVFGLRMSWIEYQKLILKNSQGLILITNEDNLFSNGFIDDVTRTGNRFILLQEHGLRNDETIGRLVEIRRDWEDILLKLQRLAKRAEETSNQ